MNSNNNQTILKISYIIIFLAICFLFYYNLMPAFIGGIVVFLIVEKIHKLIQANIHKKLSKFSNTMTVLVIIAFTVTILTLLGIGIYSTLKVGDNNFIQLGYEILQILEQIKDYLPKHLLKYIPNNIIELKEHLILLAKEHYPNMLTITANSVKSLIHIIIGMFIGAIIAFTFLIEQNKKNIIADYGILANELLTRISIFSLVFRKVVFAQLKISLINTILTGIYLIITLPLFGINIPYAKTLVVLTFLFGLIPVIGNLITNTLILILSLMVTFWVAISSLIFLVIIHKLEYYINAKIVGTEIKTSIWELLIAMVFMETIFGVIGAILAPVIYGYIKEELKTHNLIK